MARSSPDRTPVVTLPFCACALHHDSVVRRKRGARHLCIPHHLHARLKSPGHKANYFDRPHSGLRAGDPTLPTRREQTPEEKVSWKEPRRLVESLAGATCVVPLGVVSGLGVMSQDQAFHGYLRSAAHLQLRYVVRESFRQTRRLSKSVMHAEFL